MLDYIFKTIKEYFYPPVAMTVSVKYMLEDKFRYSVLTPCVENPNIGHCPYTLRYATKPSKGYMSLSTKIL
jgi:hypothetical protein